MSGCVYGTVVELSLESLVDAFSCRKEVIKSVTNWLSSDHKLILIKSYTKGHL